MRKSASLAFFLLLGVGGGLTIGFFTTPGDWYAGLNKPSFNPPDWLFVPVWALLYVLMSVAGWRTFLRDSSGWGMKLWWTQLVFNFLWSPTFFAAHRIGFALTIVLCLLAIIIIFIIVSWRQDRVASGLFAPY